MTAPWFSQHTLFLDVETTGVGTDDRIVEVGTAMVVRGQPVPGSSVLVNPGVPIPAEATAVHGITDDDVAGAPSLSDHWPMLEARLAQADNLAAYNWPFDAGMLERGLGDRWCDAIAGKPVLDALVVVRFDAVGRYWPGAGRHRLERVCQRLGIEVTGTGHRAASDALSAARLMLHLADHLPLDPLDASRLIAAERKRQDADFAAWLATQPHRS